MASISVYNIGSTSFSVKLIGLETNVAYTRRCEWTVYTSNGNYMASGYLYISPGNTEGGNYTFTGMTANSTYNISLEVYRMDTEAWIASFSATVTTTSGSGGDSGGDETEEWSHWDTTLGIIPDIFEENVTLKKYTIQIYEVEFNTSGIAKFYSMNSGDTIGFLSDSFGIDTTYGEPSGRILARDDDSGGSWNFSFEYEVTAYTTYYLYVRHQLGETKGDILVCIEAPSDPSENLPSVVTWDWRTTMDSAVSGTIKSKALSAVTNKTATTNFDHRVWNALVDKVWEITDKCGYGWDSYYATYSNTLMNTMPYELTADKFNSLRYNIGSRYSTGIEEVKSGDIVYGEYFITLANCINGWITKLRNDGILAQPE